MRIRICNPLRFYCFILVFMCFLSLLTPVVFFGVRGESEQAYETVYVRSGDTLWTIAETYKPKHKNLQSFLHEIKECNQMTDAMVYSGTTLLIPVYPETL